MRRSLATVTLAASVIGLALIVLAPAAVIAGGGCHGASEAPAQSGDDAVSTVKIDGCTFFPTTARVPVGTTVTFLNAGQVPHNITGVDWASRDLMVGTRFEHQFTEAGVYPYTCTLHAGMNGAVVVGDGADDRDEAAAAASTASTPPDEPATTDPIPFALAAVGGLTLGALLGAAIALAFARPRSTAAPIQTSPAE